MIRFALRHFTAILIAIAVGWWAMFYLPKTPTWAVFQLKQAIDSRDGDQAARYVDFQSVVQHAGQEMLKERAGNNPLGALLGQAALSVFSKPLSDLVESQAKKKVNDGDKDVQMPAVAVLGALVLMHRRGDTAWTKFTDHKNQTWDIHFTRENGVWQITEVKNMGALLQKLEKHEEKQFGTPAPAPAP